MFTKALMQIYHDPKDPGLLGSVDKLFMRAKQLHITGATSKRVQKFLQSEQAYTLPKPARRRVTRNHTYIAGIDA